MPSRKRAKGRERKLKQQAQEPAVERSVSQPPQSPNGENINLPEQNTRRIEQAENVKCYHGSVYTPQGHPVTDFMNSFIDAITCENFKVSIQESLEMTFEKHREVWKDDVMRKMAIDRIVNMGTDLIIEECIGAAKKISEAIIVLEHFDGKGNYHSALSKATEDLTYIRSAGERDAIHLHKKRIPCSCLDELYSEIKKSQVRGSTCYHCKQTIKPKAIKTCSRCKFSQYCSKECQTLDWPSHKEDCMEIAYVHKVVKKREAATKKEEGL